METTRLSWVDDGERKGGWESRKSVNHSCDDFSVNRSKYIRTVFILIRRLHFVKIYSKHFGYTDRVRRSAVVFPQSFLKTSPGTHARSRREI